MAPGRRHVPSLAALTALAALAAAAAATHTSAARGGGACATSRDCQLAGLCLASKCVCDPGWTGEDCHLLDLEPLGNDEPAAWNSEHSPSSSWGAAPFRGADGKVHGWFNALPNECGLSSWLPGSRIAHGVADTPLGPFKAGAAATPRASSPARAVRWLRVPGTCCHCSADLPPAAQQLPRRCRAAPPPRRCPVPVRTPASPVPHAPPPASPLSVGLTGSCGWLCCCGAPAPARPLRTARRREGTATRSSRTPPTRTWRTSRARRHGSCISTAESGPRTTSPPANPTAPVRQKCSAPAFPRDGSPPARTAMPRHRIQATCRAAASCSTRVS